MSLAPTLDAVDAQLKCQLLEAPYDIKRVIFNYLIPSSIHVFQDQERLRISNCVGCPPVPEHSVGEERKDGLPDDHQVRKERWARRLMSSWGQHWKCEEMMLQTRKPHDSSNDGSYHTTNALMRTCKRLQLDVSDHLSQDTTIVVTDIATLDTLLHAPTSFMGHAFHHARKLEIAFNLPIDVLTAIELQSTGKSARALPKHRSNKWAMHQAELWLRLGPALGRLKNLTKCNFWLDHSSPEYWWAFNEAAILASLLSLENRDDVELVVDLPSHAADDVPTPPFKIHRRLRQENFGVKVSNGRLSTIHKVQFPILEELASFLNEIEDTHPILTLEEVEGEKARSRRTIEAQEREMWRKGEDVEKYLKAVLGDSILCGLHAI